MILMKKLSFSLSMTVLLLLTACSVDRKPLGEINLIPKPVRMQVNPGYIELNRNFIITYPAEETRLKNTADLLSAQLQSLTEFDFKVEKAQSSRKNSIFISIDSTLRNELGPEGYILKSGYKKIEITGSAAAGVFYGIQSLIQLLPVIETGHDGEKAVSWRIPSVEITDYPRFSWRGMHLDVSRHFFPVDFVKKYIDLIAMHKMNTFHWHLTDDNGWRIQIQAYPLLTDISAWRADRESLPWGERPLQQPGEKASYGGFYTQDQIREVVQYAAERFITVIPEIEMPGHSSEVFAAYPELSCRGERLTVKTGSYWPITDIFCAGKEETFAFLENVLKEVAGLFPSKYIHIGGDEADKTEWKKCPHCQARIKNEHLSGEEELQSYFIRRMEKVLNSQGKKLIGWDEILEGGLAPEATVMSWRGYEGGIEAARQGHDVIMCPTNYCYFDYYQADPEFEPEAIGGMVTLKKVYSFNPIPSELNAEESKHILGGQGNLWTEYIATPEKAEYMTLPRMTALAEVLWAPAGSLDWEDFRARLQSQFARFRAMHVNYSEGSARVLITTGYDSVQERLNIGLETEAFGTEIFYSLDGSNPDTNAVLYKEPIATGGSAEVRTQAWKHGEPLEKPAIYKVSVHSGIGRKIYYKEMFSERYPARGEFALNDGLNGSLNFNDGMWQGFNGNDLDVVVQVKDREIRSVTASFLQDQAKWIFLPVQLVIYGSGDGKTFEKLTVLSHNIPQNTTDPITHRFEFHAPDPLKTNYLRIQALNPGECPSWHPGKGGKSWIFADEIVIN
jgi:hexosaminidase